MEIYQQGAKGRNTIGWWAEQVVQSFHGQLGMDHADGSNRLATWKRDWAAQDLTAAVRQFWVHPVFRGSGRILPEFQQGQHWINDGRRGQPGRGSRRRPRHSASSLADV